MGRFLFDTDGFFNAAVISPHVRHDVENIKMERLFYGCIYLFPARPVPTVDLSQHVKRHIHISIDYIAGQRIGAQIHSRQSINGPIILVKA
jgi:hypothetical protein